MRKKILSVLVMAFFLAMVGGVSADTGWWDSNYQYRQQVTVDNNADSVMEAGYTVEVAFDSGGKALANGDDIRVVYNGVELDRILGTETITFATQADIAVGGSDSNYYVYYGNPSAGTPLDDVSNIYYFNPIKDPSFERGGYWYNTNCGTARVLTPIKVCRYCSYVNAYEGDYVSLSESWWGCSPGITKQDSIDLTNVKKIMWYTQCSYCAGSTTFNLRINGITEDSIGFSCHDWTERISDISGYGEDSTLEIYVTRGGDTSYLLDYFGVSYDGVNFIYQDNTISQEPTTSTGPEEVDQYDKNRGHGNDADGVDEDNPGRGCEKKSDKGNRKRC